METAHAGPNREEACLFLEQTRRLYELLVAAGKVVPSKPKRFSINTAWMANEAMGRWAENTLIAGFRAAGYTTTKYGADEAGTLTDEMRKRYKAEFATLGKRPDLLMGHEDDVSLENALFAVESRSSAKDSNADYRAVMNKSLSITIKVEDLVPQTRWVLGTGIPLYVAQVFLRPEAHAISWNDVLQACLDSAPIHDRLSGKDTYMIPLDSATVARLDSAAEPAVWAGRVNRDRTGGLKPYLDPVVPGRIAIAADIAATMATGRSLQS